jgi:purine catabolism regulator
MCGSGHARLAGTRGECYSRTRETLFVCKYGTVVTVAEVLADTSLALVPVHLADGHAAIRWVATSELTDPAPFLEGGELLLTTGLEMRGWDGQWPGYVDRLAGRRVAGIGFATGLTHAMPPAGLLAACRARGMNLVEVPRSTTFVAISHTVALMLDVAAEAAARTQLAAQQQLTRAALRQDAPSALVSRLARLVDGGAALLGRDAVPPTGPRAADLDLALASAEIDRIRPRGLRAATSVQTAAGTAIVQPIGMSGRPASYLAVHVPGRAGDLERAVIAAGVALLNLAAETRRERVDAARRLRTRALELLVSGDLSSAAIVLEAGTGAPVPPPATVAVVRARHSAEVVDDAVATLEADQVMAGRVADELWSLSAPDVVTGVVEALGARGLRVGVGDPVPLASARRSHRNAGHALAVTSPATPVVWWERVVGEGALAALDEDRAEAFAASLLARLGNDQELIRTLRSFLQQNGSRLKVSEELGIHRNTVRKRIEQIERALDRSLDDPGVRASTWIALQVAATRSP